MKAKRSIITDGKTYIWSLKGNEIYTPNRWIVVTLKGTSFSKLFINPYDYDFEIKPSFIRKAILFAREKGWRPEENRGEMRLSYSKGTFIQLK